MLRNIAGLYAITPDCLEADVLYAHCRAALQGGARLLQYRDKLSDKGDKLVRAKMLAQLCRQHQALFIVNDHVELAEACAADGVHLGRDDGNVARARALLGPDKILGVSCYNQLAHAERAKQQGADYVAFGAVFASATKPDAVHAPLSLLGTAREVVGLPVVAIGGITLANAPEVVRAGADCVAVIQALFAADDIEAAAAGFARCFT